MSVVKTYTINCPFCENSISQEIYHSINTSIENVAEKILNDDINFIACKKCGRKSHVMTGFLFNNIAKQYAVYYHPTNFDQIEKEITGIKSMLGEKSYLANPYKYKYWEEFKNKIKVLEGIAEKPIANDKIIAKNEFLKTETFNKKSNRLREDKGIVFEKELLGSINAMFFDILFKNGLTPSALKFQKTIDTILDHVYNQIIDTYNKTENPTIIKSLEYVLTENNWKFITEAWKEEYLTNKSRPQSSEIWNCSICGGDDSTGCLYSDPTECPRNT